MKVFLIWAQDLAGSIGNGPGDLSTQWTSREDLQRFMQLTKEAGILVCGNTTFKTFPKGPLAKRINIVLTRNQSLLSSETPSNLIYKDQSPQELIAELEKQDFKSVAICGGAQVYQQYWESGLVTDLYVTIEPVTLTGDHLIKLDPDPLLDTSQLVLVEETIANEQGTLFQHWQDNM